MSEDWIEEYDPYELDITDEVNVVWHVAHLKQLVKDIREDKKLRYDIINLDKIEELKLIAHDLNSVLRTIQQEAR